jgi:hypothetical protein
MCTCNGSARERRPRTSVHPVSLSIDREADVREPEPGTLRGKGKRARRRHRAITSTTCAQQKRGYREKRAPLEATLEAANVPRFAAAAGSLTQLWLRVDRARAARVGSDGGRSRAARAALQRLIERPHVNTTLKTM